MQISLLGKLLIIAGSVFLCAGLLLTFFDKIPFIGKLPGDIFIKRENFTFYFPLTTSIILSLLISAMLIILKNK